MELEPLFEGLGGPWKPRKQSDGPGRLEEMLLQQQQVILEKLTPLGRALKRSSKAFERSS